MPLKELALPTDEIVARYIAGESTHVLGRAYGVDHMTIGQRLHAAGVKMRPRGARFGNQNARKDEWGTMGLSTVCGYLRAWGRDRKNHRVHRACWEAYNGPVPEGHDIHHRNGNRRDNRVENLCPMPHGEHTQMHAKQRRERGTLLARQISINHGVD